MKLLLKLVLPILLLTSQTLKADCMELGVYEMNELHTTGNGCQDGIFNAISASMLGWGVGLFIGIALLTGLVHNSHAHSTSSNNSSN